MRKITRKEFEEMDLQEVMCIMKDHDYITSLDALKGYASYLIEDNNFYLAIHILEALKECEADYYIYDYCMGTLDSPVAIEEKEDIEHLLDFE